MFTVASFYLAWDSKRFTEDIEYPVHLHNYIKLSALDYVLKTEPCMWHS